MSGEEQKPIEIKAGDTLAVAVAMDATLSVRHNLSGQLIRAARHFSVLLRQHEEAHAGKGFGPHWDQSCWLASAVFMLSFAAIETALEEAAQDRNMPDAIMLGLDRAPLFEKTQAILAHCGQPLLDAGRPPYQPVELLKQIRNALVHFKPEWTHENEKHGKLAKRIVLAGLPLTPFMPKPESAFPLGCMSAGCAEWATSAAEMFIKDVCSRLGTTPRV